LQCNEEGDGSNAVVAFFLFCFATLLHRSKEGNDNLLFFCFLLWCAAKKATTARSPSFFFSVALRCSATKKATTLLPSPSFFVFFCYAALQRSVAALRCSALERSAAVTHCSVVVQQSTTLQRNEEGDVACPAPERESLLLQPPERESLLHCSSKLRSVRAYCCNTANSGTSLAVEEKEEEP